MTEFSLRELQNIYNSLKGAEKRVADYILKDPKNVIHLSITELAEASHCGEATIVRLCKKLGCKGYQNLKIKIASEIINPMDDIYEDIHVDDSTLVMTQKVFNSSIFSLNQTLKLIDHTEMQRAIDIISSKTNLLFYGMGGSAAVAYDAYNKFLRCGKRCEFHDDSHIQAMISSLSSENDCIIAISNTGSNKELVENLQIARDNGVSVVTITSNNKSPISNVSDVILTSFGEEQMFKSEAMTSRISALCLLDCLFVGVCLRNQETYSQHIDKIRNAIALKRY